MAVSRSHHLSRGHHPADHAIGRDRGHHRGTAPGQSQRLDRKSTRLNSSHLVISYAVFCLKKKQNRCSNTTLRSTRISMSCAFVTRLSYRRARRSTSKWTPGGASRCSASTRSVRPAQPHV